jgi:enoyl-CoA hydratase/carnithine racemase
MGETCHSLVLQMRSVEKPLLASINGTAVGGGLQIVLHCDLRFAANDAKLGQPEINIAFIPPVGATQAYGRLLGRSRALRFLYEGALVSEQETLEMGLVDFVVPADRLRQRRPPMLWSLRESLPAPWQPFGIASRRV